MMGLLHKRFHSRLSRHTLENRFPHSNHRYPDKRLRYSGRHKVLPLVMRKKRPNCCHPDHSTKDRLHKQVHNKFDRCKQECCCQGNSYPNQDKEPVHKVGRTMYQPG